MLTYSEVKGSCRSKAEALRILKELRVELQALVSLANVAGDQEQAHDLSKSLCRVMELEFRVKRKW
jgi:hypothetical protein